MVIINGKVYRNLQEQVEENKNNIEELQQQDALIKHTFLIELTGENYESGTQKSFVIAFEKIDTNNSDYTENQLYAYLEGLNCILINGYSETSENVFYMENSDGFAYFDYDEDEKYSWENITINILNQGKEEI